MRPLTVRALASLCIAALPHVAHATPFYVGVEFTGGLILNGMSYNNVLITMEAKGRTEELTLEPTSAGRLYSMPVSMTMSIEGLGYTDVASDIRFYVYSDAAFAGFGHNVQQASYLFYAPGILDFNFTSSILDTPVLQGGAVPGGLMFTGLGIIAFEPSGPGSASLVLHNPAPGAATALALPAAHVLLRRRRARSG